MKTNQHSAWIIAGLLAGTTILGSCSKSDSTPSLPSIGGYNSSNDVAASNLIAHWTFDGTNNEDISKTAPSNSSNASFTTGKKGQAVQLNSGYLLYPTIAALSSANAIPSVTVSAWVNVANNGKTVSSVFALTQPTSAQDDWNRGPVNMYVETNAHPASSDTLQLHGAAHPYLSGSYTTTGVDNVNGFGLVDAGKKFQIVKGANTWVHYVMVYDGSASTFDVYANGQVVSNSDYRQRKLSDNTTPVGNLVITTPTQVLIGGMPNAATGYTKSAVQTWQGLFTGSIDEIRVYNKALSATDIGNLYQLEGAGR